MIWLGGAVSPQVIDDLWGVDNPEELDTRMVSRLSQGDISPS